MKKSKKISYSSLFLEFLQPLLDGTEDETAFMTQAKLAKMAWNFSVSDQANLSIDPKLKSILKIATKSNPQAHQALKKLIERKKTNFAQYDQFIFDIEIRTKPDGSKFFWLESTPVSLLKK